MNFSLVNAGSEVGHSDKDGMTALHCTASLGFSKCVQVKSRPESSMQKENSLDVEIVSAFFTTFRTLAGPGNNLIELLPELFEKGIEFGRFNWLYFISNRSIEVTFLGKT